MTPLSEWCLIKDQAIGNPSPVSPYLWLDDCSQLCNKCAGPILSLPCCSRHSDWMLALAARPYGLNIPSSSLCTYSDSVVSDQIKMGYENYLPHIQLNLLWWIGRNRCCIVKGVWKYNGHCNLNMHSIKRLHKPLVLSVILVSHNNEMQLRKNCLI